MTSNETHTYACSEPTSLAACLGRSASVYKWIARLGTSLFWHPLPPLPLPPRYPEMPWACIVCSFQSHNMVQWKTNFTRMSPGYVSSLKANFSLLLHHLFWKFLKKHIQICSILQKVYFCHSPWTQKGRSMFEFQKINSLQSTDKTLKSSFQRTGKNWSQSNRMGAGLFLLFQIKSGILLF